MAYNTFTTIVTNGLIFYLDPINPKSYSGSGTSSYDMKGNLLCELVNGATFSNKSFTFDGVDDYVTPGVPSIFTGTDITIDIFLNLGVQSGSYNDIIDYSHSSGGFVIQRDGTSDDYYFAYNSGVGIYGGYEIFWFTLSGITVPTDLDTHICVSKDSTNIYLYRNGVEIANGTAVSPSFTNTGLQLDIGRNASGFGRYITGSIGSVKIYNRGLTPAEVLQNYNASKNRPI